MEASLREGMLEIVWLKMRLMILNFHMLLTENTRLSCFVQLFAHFILAYSKQMMIYILEMVTDTPILQCSYKDRHIVHFVILSLVRIYLLACLCIV